MHFFFQIGHLSDKMRNKSILSTTRFRRSQQYYFIHSFDVLTAGVHCACKSRNLWLQKSACKRSAAYRNFNVSRVFYDVLQKNV